MRKKPAVFLDVDGTLTGTKSREPFKQHPHDVEVMPGVAEALNFHKKQGYRLIAVSNQGGVPQYKSLQEVVSEMEFTLSLLPQLEVIIFAPGFSGDECYVVSLPDGNLSSSHLLKITRTKKHESFRKPGWGMLQVIEGIDLDSSWMVGDRPEDEGCATAAGLNFMWAADWLTHFLGLSPAPEDLKLIQFLEVESVSF
ncbi:HAD-IIIA family hydrolase [Scytonema sp. PCC 10023]|uniref:HAD-IIIA family hydrolase n=1 Tax=Scytonema sp. PCC 10023 TaxID=1680591 RepID=UPI0039C66E48